MKKLCILSAAILIIALLVPQSAAAEVGIKGGLSFSKYSLSSSTQTVPDDKNLTAIPAGIYFSFKLGSVFAIQPEVLYFRTGMKTEGDTETDTYKSDYIQVPLLLKAHLAPSWAISPMLFAGPYGAYVLHTQTVETSGGTSVDGNMNDMIKKFDYGAVFGGGFEYKVSKATLSLEYRYTLGLMDVSKGNGMDVKNRTMSVMLGIGF